MQDCDFDYETRCPPNLISGKEAEAVFCAIKEIKEKGLRLLKETAKRQIVLQFDFLVSLWIFSNNTCIYLKFFNIQQKASGYFLNLRL